MDPKASSDNVLNINVGIMGHVDSGKTSIAKALSGVASTAAFDKHPQSKERGITIDLGFSALVVDCPEHLNDSTQKWSKLQFTFVDCPGHASLIRTIIGGSQIIHMMMLVLDVTKGMQTQTAECLVIGEITCKHMVVVLNKVDMLPSDKRAGTLEKVTRKMKLTLASTVFRDAPIVAVSANPGGTEHSDTNSPAGLSELIDHLKRVAYVPNRQTDRPMVFAVDHCFAIRGQGTVMTGTVLQGTVNVNDNVEIPALGAVKKIKSMQMFRHPVQKAQEGDRVGMCLTQFDPKQMERGIVCQPGQVSTLWSAIVKAHRIKYFRGQIRTKDKFHISIGYETVMASLTIFQSSQAAQNENEGFDFDMEYEWKEHLEENEVNQLILLKFERPVITLPNSLIIGSRLDMDANGQMCRLAFWGNIVTGIVDKNYEQTVLPRMKIYKIKSRTGTVERIVNNDHVIVKNLIKKETNAQMFVDLKVALSSGENGIIESPFGTKGKLNVHIPDTLKEETLQRLKGGTEKLEPITATLTFKWYVYDPKKKMMQT